MAEEAGKEVMHQYEGANPVPLDNMIVCVQMPKADDKNKTIGYWGTVESGNKVSAAVGAASWLWKPVTTYTRRGEHPQAADSVGINVYKMRYAGVLISGALGGLGGLVYITAGVSEWKFENGVAGFGFLALAVMIFGQWKPVNIGLAALLTGQFRTHL